ncbi:hypothetical protein ACRWWM_24410, partial [Escherichia coli]
PLTDLGGKTCIFSHPVYLFLREFSLQDSRGGSGHWVFNVQREEFPGLLGGCLVSMFSIKKVYGVFFLSGGILILH